MESSKILTLDESRESRRIVDLLLDGQSLEKALATGKMWLERIQTTINHPTNRQPANYGVLREEHWAKIKQLLQIGEVTLAIGYFGYRVLYFGADAHGNNKKAIQRPSKTPLRVNSHYTKPNSNFDRFLLFERAAGHGMTWLIESFHGKGEFNDAHEWLLIECIPHIRSEPLKNDQCGTNIEYVTISGTLDLRYRFPMILYMYHRLVMTDKIVHDREMVIRPLPFGGAAVANGDDDEADDGADSDADILNQPTSTVRFFNRNDDYTLYGADAHLAANFIFKSTANGKAMAPGSDDDKSAADHICINKGNFEMFLRELLLVKSYRVEVYTESSPSSEWAVKFKGSPGNLIQFEEMLKNAAKPTDCFIAIDIRQNDDEQKSVGIACVEQNSHTFSVIEFDDNDFLSELEAAVALLAPKEALLPSRDNEFETIAKLLERNNVIVTAPEQSEFVFEKFALIHDLNNLLEFNEGQQKNANSLPELNMAIAISSLNAAIKYLDLMADSCNMGHYKIILMNLNRFVHLDAAAVSALNLLPKPGTPIDSPAYRWQSILGVLDRCGTPQGHRLMAQWVKQPLRNEQLISERHCIVQCFVDASKPRAVLCKKLSQMPDILMLAKRLLRKCATLQDVYRLYQVVCRTPKILAILKDLDCVTINDTLCGPLEDVSKDLSMYKDMIVEIFDMDWLDNGECLMNSSLDPELGELKEDIDKLEDKMKREHSRVIEDLNLDSVDLEYISRLGYHFRVTLKEESTLRKSKKYKIVDALESGVRFTNDTLERLNLEFIATRDKYEAQQQLSLEEVNSVAATYMDPFTRLNHYVAELDCYLSFAIAAVSAPTPYVKPKMSDTSPRVLNLKGMRHPCIELQKDITFIANDVAFKEDETNMYIITGPNMGGKSTYIRSVGAAVLMAHIGSFVPCDEAIIPYVDSILSEATGIAQTATSKSLVVIDELGRGASDGCGTAWSTAAHLAKETKCFTLFATHFHEITDLANTVNTAKNSRMVGTYDVKAICEKTETSINDLKELLQNSNEEAKALCETLGDQLAIIKKLLSTEY